jgi:hypothetical protein
MSSTFGADDVRVVLGDEAMRTRRTLQLYGDFATNVFHGIGWAVS